MINRTDETRDPRLGRLMGKVTRRLVGFVLLTFTIGLTTCSALDAVKGAQTSSAYTAVYA